MAFVYVLVLLSLLIIRLIIIRQIAKAAKATETDWDDAIISTVKRIGWPVYLVVPLYVVSKTAVLPINFTEFVSWLTFVVVAVYGALSLEKLLTKMLSTLLRRRAQAHGDEVDRTIMRFASILLRIAMWTVVLLLILQNLGYKLTALLGGLGIMGVTLGFALQNILEDVFSFFSIYFDKPFEVGDLIVVEGKVGAVKKIGIKTTRIQSLHGEEIVLSNNQLTESAVKNFQRMEQRRVKFKLGVAYKTPLKKLKQIPQMIEDICSQVDDVEFTRATLDELAESSIDFEVVYHVQDNDLLLYKSVHNQVNFKILEQFEANNIELAYPTQTIILEK